MSQRTNYYVIVDRVGAQPVASWTPAATDTSSSRNTNDANPSYSVTEATSRQCELGREMNNEVAA